MSSRKKNLFDMSRRTFLKGMGASLAAAPLMAGLTGCSSAESAQGIVLTDYNTRLVLLGTMGGVSYWPDSNRASSSSALVVNDTIYLIDLGQGATYRLNEMFNAESLVNPDGTYRDTGSATFLKDVKALFFTHLHQDHIADYANLLLIGPGAGLGSIAPLKVIGPCNRGQRDYNRSGFDESRVIYTDSADPSLITDTPGTIQMTNTIWQAFAQAINDIMLDDAYPDYRSLVDVEEIGVPLPAKDSPTCPVTEPFLIYPEDENGVSVKATLVDHHQVYPAFAFRFDTPDGSVVFSGDTGPDTKGDPSLAKGNLQVLADGADVLVHEVIDQNWITYKFGENPPEGSWQYVLKQHMLTAHTAIDAVGAVARDCNVKTLVLNHIVPGMTPISHLRQAQQNFSGNFIIGEDLMQIGIGKADIKVVPLAQTSVKP
jgi:ribonuclease BN (tRNA processing enzyme)